MGKRNQFVSKHVRETASQGFPEPEGDQFLVKLVRSRGGNTMECQCSDGSTTLVWLPAKFSKVVWAQRGDFLIVEPAQAEEGAKVTGTIVHILFPEQVQHLRKLPCWPEGFGQSESQSAAASDRTDKGAASGMPVGESSEEEDADDDLFVNNNRLHEDSYESEEEEEEGEDDA